MDKPQDKDDPIVRGAHRFQPFVCGTRRVARIHDMRYEVRCATCDDVKSSWRSSSAARRACINASDKPCSKCGAD